MAFGAQSQAAPEKTARDQRLEELDDVITHHRALLVRIFTYYCSFGEPLNTNKMRSSKFIKFLKDAGLLQNAQSSNKVGTMTSGQKSATLNHASLRNQQHYDKMTGPDFNATGGRADSQGRKTPILSGRDSQQNSRML